MGFCLCLVFVTVGNCDQRSAKAARGRPAVLQQGTGPSQTTAQKLKQKGKAGAYLLPAAAKGSCPLYVSICNKDSVKQESLPHLCCFPRNQKLLSFILIPILIHYKKSILLLWISLN